MEEVSYKFVFLLKIWERFEFCIRRPQKLLQNRKMVLKWNHFEHLVIDLPDEHTGAIIENLEKEKLIWLTWYQWVLVAELEFEIPARGLSGIRTEFLTETKRWRVL